MGGGARGSFTPRGGGCSRGGVAPGEEGMHDTSGFAMGGVHRGREWK
jgi:hypothetical protein